MTIAQEYAEILASSPTFREEAISSCASEILTAYNQRDHLPAVIDTIIEREAAKVIAAALDEYPSPKSDRQKCADKVRLYTIYDPKKANAA